MQVGIQLVAHTRTVSSTGTGPGKEHVVLIRLVPGGFNFGVFMFNIHISRCFAIFRLAVLYTCFSVLLQLLWAHIWSRNSDFLGPCFLLGSQLLSNALWLVALGHAP